MGEFPGSASGLGVGFDNVQFAQAIEVVPRIIFIIGTFDPALTAVVADVPVRIFNANEAGVKFGFGFMIHRLADRAFQSSQNLETWVVPQDEAGGGSAATKSIDFDTSDVTVAGQLFLYIAGILVESINLAVGEQETEILAKVEAAVNAQKILPMSVTATAVTDLDLTSKSQGPWGNDITVAFNLRGESLPAGVVAVVNAGASGAGIPDVQTALDGTGTGDNQNEQFFTDLICGYGQDTSTLDKISIYNGTGDDFVGNYKKVIQRPFRAFVGDTAPGTAGLTALIVLADGRAELDRTNGVLAEPGSSHHPMEIAALNIGIMARTNNVRAQENYLDKIMIGLIPSPGDTRWTNDYTNRDTAFINGISTTQVKNLVVTLQDSVTFYRPGAVTPESNGYRSMRNISIIQNIGANEKANFDLEKWKGISIVKDAGKVSNNLDAEKTRDIEDVVDDLVVLTFLFESKSWIFDAGFTIDRLKAGGLVELRSDGRGFNIIHPLIFSGEGGIRNITVRFDTSLTILI